jgi:hypothetical protein
MAFAGNQTIPMGSSRSKSTGGGCWVFPLRTVRVHSGISAEALPQGCTEGLSWLPCLKKRSDQHRAGHPEMLQVMFPFLRCGAHGGGTKGGRTIRPKPTLYHHFLLSDLSKIKFNQNGHGKFSAPHVSKLWPPPFTRPWKLLLRRCCSSWASPCSTLPCRPHLFHTLQEPPSDLAPRWLLSSG